jgi:ammonia channel protein AmtB
METRIGTIAGISGSMGSGLWQLWFEDGSMVHISSGMGVRALALAFGARGEDLLEKIQGQEIYYTIDGMGLGVMAGFTPVDNWDPDLWDEEG